jgi:hypothetical protein
VGGRRRPFPTGAGEVAWCASSTTSASGLLRSSEHALCFPDHEHKHEHDDLLCLSSLCCWVGRLPLSCSIFWLAFSSSLASGLLPHSPSISYLSFSPLLYFDFFSCVVIRQDRSNHFVMLIIVFYRSACWSICGDGINLCALNINNGCWWTITIFLEIYFTPGQILKCMHVHCQCRWTAKSSFNLYVHNSIF